MESYKMQAVLLYFSVVPLFVFCTCFEESKNRTAKPRIAGGDNADKEEFPYQGLIVFFRINKYVGRCGCSLLASDWAITAAHCTENETARNLKIYFGNTSRYSSVHESNDYYFVQGIYNHPLYKEQNFRYDVSLLKLKGRVSFSRSVDTIDLPELNKTETSHCEQLCWITG